MLTKLFWIVLPLVALLPHEAMAQNIQSITCYGYGGDSCSEWRFFQYTGSLQCTCAATCYNPPNNISAAMSVYWYCGSPQTGYVQGGAQSSSVKVEGGTNGAPYNESGYDEQFCDGTRTGFAYTSPC
jgi:hypothetical protein